MLRWLHDKVRRDDARSQAVDINVDASIGADVPIRTASQDRLRRVEYAERIADILSTLSLEEGRVFAIRGSWGFGKSSLKHLIFEQLTQRANGADWLDFNPWQWGDSNAIARALFGEIANSLGGAYSEGAARRAAKLRAYGAILTGAAEPLAKAGNKTQLLSSILTNASVVAIATSVGFSLPTVATIAACIAVLAGGLPLAGKVLNYLGRDRAAEPLDQIRRSLETNLRELTQPLVVFVDDIDRLEPEQIRLLLRQIKANANLPNLVFVLIFQPSIVEAALNPISDGNGAAFLEKIVQANFDLPEIPASTVHRIFSEQLSELAGTYATEENGFQQVRWGNCLIGCIQPYINNLRDARRLLSSIAAHLPLHSADNTFEVNIVDFLVLETIRVFEPDLHGRLFREKDLVLQAHRFEGDGRSERDKPRIEGLLDAVCAERRDIAQDALKELFPQIAWVFENMHYGSEWHSEWLAEKRVCSTRYFPRYFELQTPVGELSESEFVFLLEASSNEDALSRALADVEDRDLLPALAYRLDESVNRLPIANSAILLPAMFGLGQKLVARRSDGPFNSPWVSAWRAVSWFLKRIPEEKRGDLVIEALRTSGALSVGATIIHLNDPERHKDEDRANFEPALDENTVHALKEEWLRQIVVLASSPERMLSQPDLLNLLYRWRDYTGSFEAPKDWIEKSIDSDARFTSFVTRMMSRGTTSGWGDRVSAPYDTFRKEEVEDFVGIDAALARVEAIDLDMVSSDEAHAMQTLRRHLVAWSDGEAVD